jgi:hypothetical protein
MWKEEKINEETLREGWEEDKETKMKMNKDSLRLITGLYIHAVSTKYYIAWTETEE